MTTTTLTIPNISCGHCKSSIEGAVQDLTGIESVEVHIDPKTVDLSFDDTAVSLDTIIEIIEESGYDVTK